MHEEMHHHGMPDEPVSVEIYDQIYTLRGTDAAYIERLAQVVDSKMRAVAEQSNTVDSLRVAVLASLNIADELLCLRERFRQVAATQTEVVRSRSASRRAG
jgi:cell division protein ZapA